MDNKNCQRAVKTALSTIIGLSISGVLIAPTVRANGYQAQDGEVTSPIHNVLAKTSTAPVKEFLVTKLYQHQWDDQDAVTLHYNNIPLLTFLDTPDGKAINNATNFAKKLEQLSSNSAQASEINVAWNAKTEDYVITFANNELVRINEYVILPDSTEDLAHDALQATNRLRRLMGNATPLKEVKGQPKVVAKKQTQKATFAGVKNLRKAAQGIASWYGPGFHGRKTASGERFNQNALTAAHRSLPFGTRVKVTNLNNGRSVVVRINDRGPFTRGRIVDLSAGAARVIGLKNSGVAPVRIQILGR
ncbi:septal ring lytic transglycosylase RlpA family protein [Cyanobacterium aponinum UTEX 3222]|uniref:septal ring lytic transglycosylase RlpA family protein n=1 Tax=Cyanobacterium aponinum TaxID=379064 RepID=UPI00308C849A|nr:septal ring lytic transglycosylase RlpA family protein [Cyanobacterium aponinum UTEX 3222]